MNAVSATANSGTTYERTAMVTCQTGYTSNGATGIITCGGNGTWTGFTCDGKLWLQAAICFNHDLWAHIESKHSLYSISHGNVPTFVKYMRKLAKLAEVQNRYFCLWNQNYDA